MNHLLKSQRLLIYFSWFDIIFSTTFIIAVGLYAATCHVEDESVINHEVKLGQIKYFYHALEACGYKEESDIPHTDSICVDLGTKVTPLAGFSLALNFILGVFMQIMIRDKYFFIDKRCQRYSTAMSLVCIPIVTLLSMSLASIALNEYTKLCWLAYSISEQRKTVAYLIAVIVIPVILVIYKPLELSMFYWYGCSLLKHGTKNDPIREVKTVRELSHIEPKEFRQSRTGNAS